jgi:hypothetical protein
MFGCSFYEEQDAQMREEVSRLLDDVISEVANLSLAEVNYRE